MRLLTLISLLLAACSTGRDSFYYFEKGKEELINTNSYEAIRHFTKSIKLKADNYKAYHYRAAAYMGLDSITRAIQDYDTLIKYTTTQEELGTLLVLKGDALYLWSQDELACLYYQKARDLNNKQAWDKVRKVCK